MKQRILIVIACALSCVIIFGSIIAYKKHKKANADINISQSTSITEITTEKDTETTSVKSTEEVTKKESTTEKTYLVLAESKADMISLVNNLTTKASQGNYKLTRVCYVEDEFAASDVKALDKIVQNVNPNTTFNSAINKHLNVGTTKASVQNGKATTEIKKEYLLKSMCITVDDVKNWHQYENKIVINLVSSHSATGVMHITNDYITPASIRTFFSKYSTDYEMNSAFMGYGPTSLELTIDDGKLTSLKISLSVTADVELSPYNQMEGTYVTETTYSNFVYN